MINAGRRMLSLGVLGTVLALGACAPRSQAVAEKPVDTSADEAAIRQVLDGIASNFDEGNYDAMLALYRDDVIVSAPGSPDSVGKDAWRAGLAKLPQNVKMKLRFDTTELEVDGDLAYERGTFTMDMSDPTTNAALQSVTARHIHIFKREPDGSWKGWRLMENSADPVPAAAPPPP